MFPHEYLQAYLRELMGRRTAVLGPWMDTILGPLVIGLADQLSIYQEQVGHPADLRLSGVQIRETTHRTHVLIGLRDHHAPLRLRRHVERWDCTPDTSRPQDWVLANIARRWRFIERHSKLFEQLFSRLADQLLCYATQRPRSRLLGTGGMNRLVEDLDRTWLVIDLDRQDPEIEDHWSDRWQV